LIYPGAFCTELGPPHWSLLIRFRALENQTFVIAASPARDTKSNYVAWGHSMVVDPWGKIVKEANEKDMDLYVDLGKYDLYYPQLIFPFCLKTSFILNILLFIKCIDFTLRENIKQQIPTGSQRRTDIYDTIEVKKI